MCQGVSTISSDLFSLSCSAVNSCPASPNSEFHPRVPSFDFMAKYASKLFSSQQASDGEVGTTFIYILGYCYREYHTDIYILICTYSSRLLMLLLHLPLLLLLLLLPLLLLLLLPLSLLPLSLLLLLLLLLPLSLLLLLPLLLLPLLLLFLPLLLLPLSLLPPSLLLRGLVNPPTLTMLVRWRRE